MSKTKKVFIILFLFIIVISVFTGCGKKNKDKIKEQDSQITQIDGEGDGLEEQTNNEEVSPENLESIYQTVKVDEKNSNLIFLNSLINAGGEVLDTDYINKKKIYTLSPPAIPKNQKEVSERIGHTLIEVFTNIEDGLEVEEEIRMTFQNNSNELFGIHLPEMILIEKIYGVPFKDANSIFNKHKKDYIDSNYKKFATYNTNTLLNNVWSANLKSSFFGYDVSGKEIEKSVTLTLKKNPDNILRIYNNIYKNLIKQGYDIDYDKENDLISMALEKGVIKTEIKLYKDYVEVLQRGTKDDVYRNWNNTLRILNDIEIYNVMDFKNIENNTMNILNYVKDVPYRISNTVDLNIVTMKEEGVFQSKFKTINTSSSNKDFSVEINLKEDKLNERLELKTKIVPLFLKK